MLVLGIGFLHFDAKEPCSNRRTGSLAFAKGALKASSAAKSEGPALFALGVAHQLLETCNIGDLKIAALASQEGD